MIDHSFANDFFQTSDKHQKPGRIVIDPPSQAMLIKFEGYTVTNKIAINEKISLCALCLQQTIKKETKWTKAIFN
jgi:hypothetical protein